MDQLNKLLVLLGLRRPPGQVWDPPTLLDELLASPLRWAAGRLYGALLALRGWHPLLPLLELSHYLRRRPTTHARRRGRRRPIRVVALSDTHGLAPPVPLPGGDLLIHCGDLTAGGSAREIGEQLGWLRRAGAGFRHRVLVGGNHDVWFDPEQRRRLRLEAGGAGGGGGGGEGDEAVDGEAVDGVDLSGFEYLCDRSVTLEFSDDEEDAGKGAVGGGGGGKRRLNVYGWGAVPRCGDGFAYQYERGEDVWRGRIPLETDVLVTHTPPAHHRDLGLGCASLLEEVWRVRPKLHVFGHIHWGHGRESVYYDECQRAYESLMARPAKGFLHDLIPSARWVDAFNVLRYGIGSVLWKWLMLGPGSDDGGLLVNASVMYGNTGRLGNPVMVVDL